VLTLKLVVIERKIIIIIIKKSKIIYFFIMFFFSFDVCFCLRYSLTRGRVRHLPVNVMFDDVECSGWLC